MIPKFFRRLVIRLSKGNEPTQVEVVVKPGEDPFQVLADLNDKLPEEWEVTLVVPDPPQNGGNDGQIWS